MPRTSAERIGGAAAYGFVLLTTVVSLLYLIGGEFKPATLALLGAPLERQFSCTCAAPGSSSSMLSTHC